MTSEELEHKGHIAHINESETGAITKREAQSDIQTYKAVLRDRFTIAKTKEEFDELIILRKKVHQLDTEDRRLDYSQQLAKAQLQEAQWKANFQRGQQGIAIVASLGVGIYFSHTFPLASLLFLILGLARPLGYSLGEISKLLDGLKRLPQNSNKSQSNEGEKEFQFEEDVDARF